MGVFVLPVRQLNKKGLQQLARQFCNSNSTGKKKKINRLYRQRNFVSVKVPVKTETSSDNRQQNFIIFKVTVAVKVGKKW